MIGDKYYTEALDAQLAVRGSNDKDGEIPFRRKPEVSWAMLVIPGLVGT